MSGLHNTPSRVDPSDINPTFQHESSPYLHRLYNLHEVQISNGRPYARLPQAYMVELGIRSRDVRVLASINYYPMVFSNIDDASDAAKLLMDYVFRSERQEPKSFENLDSSEVQVMSVQLVDGHEGLVKVVKLPVVDCRSFWEY